MSIVPPTLAVEIAFATGANPNAWVLDATAFPVTLGPAEIDTWTDVVADARVSTVQRGRSRELDEFRAGRMSLSLDNEDRDYDPLNLAGAHVSGGETQVKPGRAIRLLATHPTTAVQYPIFRGTIRDWAFSWAEPGAVAGVTASDLMEDLANTEVDFTITAGLSGSAFTQLAVAAGLGRIRVDGGSSQLQETPIATTAMAAARLIEHSELGSVYVDSEGFLTFEGRHSTITEARSNTSQATFVNDRIAGDLKYSAIVPDYNSTLIRNSISLQRTGGVAQTAEDATSIADFSTRSFSRTGLMNATDAELDDLADYLLGGFKDPTFRIRAITIEATENAALMTQALSRKLRDRVTVRYQPVGTGTEITAELLIAGISHTFAPGRLTTTFTFETTDLAYGWVLDESAFPVRLGA